MSAFGGAQFGKLLHGNESVVPALRQALLSANDGRRRHQSPCQRSQMGSKQVALLHLAFTEVLRSQSKDLVFDVGSICANMCNAL